METTTRIKFRQYTSASGVRQLEYKVYVGDTFLGTASRCRDAEALIQNHLQSVPN